MRMFAIVLDEQAENIDTILKKVDTMQNEECKLDDIFKSNSHLPSPNSTSISIVYVLYAKSHAHVCHCIAFTYSPRPAR
jgi:hypothetical protein